MITDNDIPRIFLDVLSDRRLTRGDVAVYGVALHRLSFYRPVLWRSRRTGDILPRTRPTHINRSIGRLAGLGYLRQVDTGLILTLGENDPPAPVEPRGPESVYALSDPDSPDVVRYVGRSIDPRWRLDRHMTAPSRKMREWIIELRSRGVRPQLVVVEVCAAEQIGQREGWWIRHYRAQGMADLNTVIPVVRP